MKIKRKDFYLNDHMVFMQMENILLCKIFITSVNRPPCRGIKMSQRLLNIDIHLCPGAPPTLSYSICSTLPMKSQKVCLSAVVILDFLLFSTPSCWADLVRLFLVDRYKDTHQLVVSN